LSDLFSNYQNFFPWVAFIAGLGGSIHCVGMCGGLVTASCQQNTDILKYQIGRLIGYLFLGLIGGSLGSFLKIQTHSKMLNTIPGIIIGIIFIFWGFQNYLGKKAELPMPKFMSTFYAYLWKKCVYKNHSLNKAFFTGLISIFLPCGLLYGIVLSTLALQHPLMALTSMFFFWLGTVPSMVLAPSLFQKILNPIKNQLPKTYGISLILLGLLTVSYRVIKFNEISEHQKKAGLNSPAEQQMCH
jgi:sulfite exporter TauE/SafE